MEFRGKAVELGSASKLPVLCRVGWTSCIFSQGLGGVQVHQAATARDVICAGQGGGSLLWPSRC